MSNPTTTLRLGARGSLLSRMQSQLVADALQSAHPGLRVELVTITTTGDRITDRPLHDLGGKGLFTKELEIALLAGEMDFVVHSFKDLPVTMPLHDTSELIIAATPPREDPRDVLASSSARNIRELPQNARVGTSSLRRQAQLLALRPDLQILPIRGNIDTRLRKLRENQFDAIVLALAGLTRAKLFDPSLMNAIPLDEMLPAAGQAALAIQCRRDAVAVRELLACLHHPPTFLAVSLEREIVLHLKGDCHSPIAALAELLDDNRIALRALAAARDGRPPLLTAAVTVPASSAAIAPEQVASALIAQGAMKLLHDSI